MAMPDCETFLYDRVIKKDYDYKMWFFFPGCEAFALSSLGYLWLFKNIDETEDIAIERIYSDTQTTKLMRGEISLVGISNSFDMDFLEVFSFFEKNNFAFKAKDRTDADPLIFAGGPVITANPEPYCEIYDFMIIGDGEDVNTAVINLCKSNKNKPKSEILNILSRIEGVYVPSAGQKTIKKVTKKLTECVYTPILSKKSFFSNTFIIEVERGCANRCGFCLASYINLPLRFVPYDKIIDAIELGLANTNKIALLGAQLTAHPKFENICRYIENKINNGKNIEMSVSSLRADSFKPAIINTLVKAGQKNLTLALEAGSERLRRVINKNLTEEQIFAAVDAAAGCGLKGLKFYGILGLPTETQEDVNEIVELTKRIKQRHKSFEISYGFSTFVPKAHTPFQWCGREDENILEKKVRFLTKELNKTGVKISVSSLKWDYWQAVLSRGGRELTDFLIETYRLGGKTGAFKKAAKVLHINPDFYAVKNYALTDDLPWDKISIRPEKDFLIKEHIRLLAADC